MQTYAPLNKSSLSMQIADQLEARILQNQLKEGEKLPGEMELAERFGASRNVLREAMTTLKERGLIEVRNGSGAYVVHPQAEKLGQVVSRLVITGSVSADELFEVRMALEVRACGLAAQNATPEEIEKLQTLLDDMERSYEDSGLWAQFDYDFHILLARCTGNVLFPVLLEPLISLVTDNFNKMPLPLEARKRGMAHHRTIMDAVKAHDRAAAEKGMVLHLQRYLEDQNRIKK